jgi:hypothetical protein
VIRTAEAHKNRNITSELARVLGFLVGDGHIAKMFGPSHPDFGPKYRIQLSNHKDIILDQFKHDIETHYDKRQHWHETKFNHIVDGYNGFSRFIYCYNKTICNNLIHLGIPRGNKSSIIRVPRDVMQSDPRIKAEFLKALFTCDGTISKHGYKNQNYQIALSTVSNKLAEDVMILLTELGFTPYMNSHKPPKMNDGYIRKRRYWVSMFRRQDIFRFYEKIGFVGSKQEKLIDCCNDLRKRLNNKYKWQVRNPFLIKSIKRIKPCMNIYDIETEKNHNYITKTAIMHNSFREDMGILDIQNIIAKMCVHCIWIYPSDFIARNSVYGLETYGKDLKNKLIRCIVYDVRKTMMGLATPLGYIIVPKLQEPGYQQMPEKDWSEYRIKNKTALQRPDFDSLLEEQYEQKKDTWIQKEQQRDFGTHHEERFKLGVWLGKQPRFQEAGSKPKQHVLARNVFRDLAEGEIAELVEIARMGIEASDIEELRQQQIHDTQPQADEEAEKKKAMTKK